MAHKLTEREIRKLRREERGQLRIKQVFRYDPTQRKLRLFRLLWNRGKPGDGVGYSNKLSFALAPQLAGWMTGFNEWELTVLGLRIHRKRDYGGRMS